MRLQQCDLGGTQLLPISLNFGSVSVFIASGRASIPNHFTLEKHFLYLNFPLFRLLCITGGHLKQILCNLLPSTLILGCGIVYMGYDG